MKMVSVKSKKVYIDCAYLVILAFYLFKAGIDTAMFSISWPEWYNTTIKYIAIFMVVLKIFTEQMYKEKRSILALISIIILALAYKNTDYEYLLMLAVLMIGAWNIDYHLIMKVVFWVSLLTLFLAVFGCSIGVIDNLTYGPRNGKYRHSLGIVYPTDLAARILSLLLVFWVAFDSIPSWVTMVLNIAAMGFLYMFADARCSLGCMVLVVISTVYLSLRKWIGKKNKILKIFSVLEKSLIILMPILSALIMGITYFYNADNEKWVSLNHFFSSRLSLGNEAIKKYGFSLLGNPFDMIGNGGDIAYQFGYNFIDCSYIMIAIRYGILALLVVEIVHIYLVKQSNKCGNLRITFAVGIIAVASVVEHHLTELAYNSFWLLCFAVLQKQDKAEKEKVIAAKSRKSYWITIVITIIFVGLIIMFYPSIVSTMKTVATLRGWKERNSVFIKYTLVFIVLFGVVFWGVISIVRELLNPSKLSEKISLKIMMVSVCMACILLGFGFFKCNKLIVESMELYEETIEDNTKVLTKILELDNHGRIYVNDVPAMYEKKIPGLSRLAVPQEMLSYGRNQTLVTDNGLEQSALLEYGYLYAELSEQYGIYTNNRNVMERLEELGYEPVNYFNVVKHFEPDDMAGLNGTECNENGNSIATQEMPIRHGPYGTIRRGNVGIYFRMKLLNCNLLESFSDQYVNVRFAVGYGNRIIWEERHPLTDFYVREEDGAYILEVKTSIFLPGTYNGVELLVFPEGDVQVEIEEISYGKIPNP